MPTKYLFLLAVMFLAVLHVHAQSDACTGVLMNSAEQKPMANAMIVIKNVSEVIYSNANGQFSIDAPHAHPAELEIHSLNCETMQATLDCAHGDDTIYVYCPAYELQPVNIMYQDATTIMQKAIRQIPVLYPDSAYIAYGFYRNYRKINNRFRELTEARIATAMRISKEETKLSCNEAYAVRSIRQTPYTLPISAFYDHQLEDLFRQQPVYHIEISPLSNLYFDHTLFVIDSVASTDSTWLIRYAMRRFTTENHGVDNYAPEAYAGEGRETGYFVINRSDHAILKYVRESVRNPKYEYPNHNNFLLPDLYYTGAFIEGYLECDYAFTEGRYYPAHIFHAFTNEFTHVATNMVAYRVTDYAEWFCDSTGFIIDKQLMQTFEDYRNDLDYSYLYDAEDWAKTPRWIFVQDADVWRDLSQLSEPSDLFMSGGK